MPLTAAQLARVIDCHAHPHDTPQYNPTQAREAEIRCAKMCCMSSNLVNQDMTWELYTMHPSQIIPCYGIHPWFCHAICFEEELPPKDAHYQILYPEMPDGLLERLPDPVLWKDLRHKLASFMQKTGDAMVGEIGLDKSFKLPLSGGLIAPHSVPGRQGPIEYTNLKTPMAHQVALVEAHFDLATELGRNVSVHCVQAQGPLMELIHRSAKKHGKKWATVNIDLHSFGGSAQVIQDLQKRYSNIFFSFSTTINSRSPRLRENIQAVSEDRLLVESDWNSLDGYWDQLSEIVDLVADARQWDIETALNQLERNWRLFSGCTS